jgi:DNA mismatch repair ATPase MutS
MQAGMLVGARSFSGALCTALFTHYGREEDASMKSGVLDEELAGMSQIAEHLAPGAMLLCNESFAATNEREGSEIAGQIVLAMLHKRVKVFFVTHPYEFAHGLFEKEMGAAIFLRAERRSDGTRAFRMVEGEPLQTSYGRDLYEKVFSAEEARGEPA